MIEQHEVLIIEDKPTNAATLLEIVQSLDMKGRIVTTLAEVRELLATGYVPCAVLQDIQIPHAPGAGPHEKSGESSIALLQARFGKGTVPIIVVTAFRSDPDYVWEMSELQVQGFVAKSNIQALPDKLRAAMRKAGREDHAKCAACGVGAGSVAPVVTPNEPEKSRVTLAIDGETIRGRTSLRACGQQVTMTDVPLAVLLRAVLAHERLIGTWTDKYELGIGDDRGMATRVRDPFKGVVPEGFLVLESDGRKQFRLNPEMIIESVNWETLAKHPDPATRNIALQALKRKTRPAEVDA